MFTDKPYNWFEASHLCASQNLHLVEIDSEKKNTDLIHVLKIYPGSSRNLWLGANDEFNQAKDKKRAFYWSSGKKMVFNFWSIENPNNAASNEHCAHIWHSKANFEWNDNVCTNKMGYICEKEVQ
uniref:C-type lectin domain-containing protein n=1 Tax=Stomoxys calcitrans TaxID=35570 RepID=A0A1I8Q2N9_STOCA